MTFGGCVAGAAHHVHRPGQCVGLTEVGEHHRPRLPVEAAYAGLHVSTPLVVDDHPGNLQPPVLADHLSPLHHRFQAGRGEDRSVELGLGGRGGIHRRFGGYRCGQLGADRRPHVDVAVDRRGSASEHRCRVGVVRSDDDVQVIGTVALPAPQSQGETHSQAPGRVLVQIDPGVATGAVVQRRTRR